MTLAEILLIALGLAMDAFAVSLAAGSSGRAPGKRAAFRLSFHFGLFQFLMPILGWFAGSTIAGYMASVDHWIAFGLLAFVGIRMIRGGLGADEDASYTDPSRGWTLVMLSIATSIEAFAIGLSIALLQVTIWYPSVIIGIVAAALSLLGLKLGKRLGLRFGKRMEIMGGLILVGIGVRIVITHVWG